MRNKAEKKTYVAPLEKWCPPTDEDAHVGLTSFLGDLGQVIRAMFRWQIPQSLHPCECFVWIKNLSRLHTAFMKLLTQAQ